MGNLTFNNIGDSYFLTGIQGADGSDLRTPTDVRSQKDGGIVHRFFHGHMLPVIDGYFKASTVSSRNTFEDTLKGYLNSILRADGKWRMVPSGKAERFLTARLYQPVVITPTDGIVHSFTFGLITSREPFWGDYAETDTTIASGANANVTNGGNTDSYPIFEVYAASSGFSYQFTLTNTTTGQKIETVDMSIAPFDPVLGGDHVEIDTYYGTMYEIGIGSPVNKLGQLDESVSDFFTLAPGVNNISLSGDFDHVVVKSRNAWV